jgi:hypothetical protein
LSADLGRGSGQERGKGPDTARVGRASQKAKGKCQKSKCPGGDGCQEPGDLRTQAAERNNVAKTTILHEPDTESETEPYTEFDTEPNTEPDKELSIEPDKELNREPDRELNRELGRQSTPRGGQSGRIRHNHPSDRQLGSFLVWLQ